MDSKVCHVCVGVLKNTKKKRYKENQWNVYYRQYYIIHYIKYFLIFGLAIILIFSEWHFSIWLWLNTRLRLALLYLLASPELIIKQICDNFYERLKWLISLLISFHWPFVFTWALKFIKSPVETRIQRTVAKGRTFIHQKCICTVGTTKAIQSLWCGKQCQWPDIIRLSILQSEQRSKQFRENGNIVQKKK